MRVPLFDVQPRLCRDFDMLKMASSDNLSCFAVRFSSKNFFWESSDEMQAIETLFIVAWVVISVDSEQSLFYSNVVGKKTKQVSMRMCL